MNMIIEHLTYENLIIIVKYIKFYLPVKELFSGKSFGYTIFLSGTQAQVTITMQNTK